MGWSIVYAVTLTVVIVAALRASALMSLLFVLAISVLATVMLALMNSDDDLLWASLIVPPGLLLASLALTSALDRFARRSWHRS